ncbi:MAG: hypothetical protein WDN04_15055 [Rhodospirillales bacterium]
MAAILLSIGVLTRPMSDVAWLWMLAWFALFAAWIGLSRLGITRYWGPHRRPADGCVNLS